MTCTERLAGAWSPEFVAGGLLADWWVPRRGPVCAEERPGGADLLRVTRRYFVLENSYQELCRPAPPLKAGFPGASGLALMMGVRIWQRAQRRAGAV